MSWDRLAFADRDDVLSVVGCSLAESLVWPMRVVVLDVLIEEPSELALVPDDCSIQQLMAQSSYPPLGVRVGLG